MAKKFVWMDGTTHDTADPKWDEEEAVKRGLIPSSGQVRTVIWKTPSMSPVMRLHLADCQHAADTGSNTPD